MPDVEYKPPASSLQVLPSTSTSRKDSPKEVSRSKHSPSRPLGSQVSPTIQPRTNPKLQKPQKPPNSNKHKTSVTSTQAEEIRLAGKTDALHKKWLEEYKLVVMGGGGADKSSFVIQLIQSHFVDEYDPTIEDSYRKQCVIDDRVALLDVLDTAGQEEYSAMRAQYMKTGEGFVLMYSITSRTSLDDACALYTELLRVKNKDYSPIILVGNHCERENERQISKQEGETLARSWGCPFVEASAKERINVEKAFYDLVREIRRYIRSELQAISHKRIQDMKEQESPPRGGLKEFLVRRRRP
ncbi:ras-domain-containing protein [Acephala macrosclerotiorum]|nr:ras-domain-containing protein [Acephala macrosclerotiorum]